MRGAGKTRGWFTALAICGLLWPGQPEAAERTAETVVVTAGRIAEAERAVPQAMTVIDSETLDKNQYEDLSGLLQAYGFSIDSYGPNQSSSQVSIRGMSSNFSNPLDSNVLILVNGAPIATTNLAQIPMDGIEQVEILRGPGAVQYGSSAVGGVVNIIPKRGGEQFHLSAEAGYGTWNAWRAMGSLSGRLKMFDFAGAVTWNAQRSNYTTGDGKLYQDTEADGRLGYLMNFGFNFNEENRLGAVILGSQDLGLGLSQSLTQEQRYNGMDIKAKRINSSVDVTYDGGYSPAGLSWKARYFNAYDQFKVMYPGNYVLNTPYYTYEDYVIENNQAGGSGQISWAYKFMTLTAGLDYTESEYSSGFAPRYQQTDTAPWAMLKLSFLDDMIVLNGGWRYDAYTFKVDGDSQDLQNSSLSAGIAFNPWDFLTLRANIGESYKVPSGLYVVGYEGPNGVKGNSSLEPEKGLTWDVGLDARWRGLRLGLTYFATQYRDKILNEPISEPGYTSMYYNQSGESFINGLEGSLSFDLGEFYDWEFMLRPYLNFTKLFQYSDADGERLMNTRELTASFGLNFNHPDWDLDADLRFTYLGFQHEYNFSAPYPYPEVRTGDKLIGDFFISKTVYETEDWGKLSVKGEIRNFTNENYAYRYDYPMPGRSFYVGVRYDF
ncbi:MAG: TonB-dependent receptor [Desulfovibrio sp.]|nr:TonB-dependent receptor [Desulfovibrio sp.]